MEEERFEKLLSELALQFREQWSLHSAPDYESFLDRIPKDFRIRLLVKLIQEDMELSVEKTTQELVSADIDEDDQRVEPRLDLFLLRFPELRSSFDACRDLAIFEFAIHRRTRHPFEIQHYLDLLPEYASPLFRDLSRTDEKLVETSLAPDRYEPSNPGDSTVADGVGEPLQVWRLPKQLGNFQLLSLLGRGGMGTVFRALDLRTGGICAVKVMRRTDAWSVYRFNEEFRALAALDHPNIARLFESFSDDGIRFFSMELIEGSLLTKWWRRRSEQSRWELLSEVLWQIAKGIHFLHNRGIKHGDIKPGNVLVTKRGRAVILDLGLATFVDDDFKGQREHVERLVGTLNYMAPEVAQGNPVTRESDWYSFGAIIWELMLGEAPHPPSRDASENESTLLAVNERKALLENSGGPSDLIQLCAELLSPNAEDRPTASNILERLRLPSRPIPQFLDPASFVGRSAELSEIDSFIQSNSHQGLGRLVLLEGDHGLGKTRLVEEWIRRSHSDVHRLVVRATCNFKDSAPFRLINLLVQSFVQQWRQHRLEPLPRDERNQRIARGFPQYMQLIVPAHESKSVVDHEVISEEDLHRAACEFAKLLCEQSEIRPVILVVDDGQNSDDASINAMLELWNPYIPFRGIVFAGYRSLGPLDTPPSRIKEEALDSIESAPNPPVTKKIILEPMPPADANQLATVLLTRPGMPILPTMVLAVGFAEMSRGNPQLLEELVRSFCESDPTGESWLARLDAMRGQEVEQFRFQRLKRESQQIIEFLSVARMPVSFQQLQIATRVGPELLFPILGDLASKQWIHWHGRWPDLKLAIANPSLQEQVRKWTDPDCLQRRHARLAHSLALEVVKPWGEIAFHYTEAGRARRAVDAYLEAANQAASLSEVDVARTYIEQARSVQPLSRPQLEYQLKIENSLRKLA